MERLVLRVIGVVQGVGFRPFVHRLAGELSLRGFILNDAQGVSIEVEGGGAEVREFLARLHADKPRAAILFAVDARFVAPVGHEHFEIRASVTGGEARAWLLPDLGLCEDCAREMLDVDDRRHGYPFLNCTNCGPRYTILESLPYDRAATSMKGFEMCADCRAEYEEPTDRRFHAQPTACAKCGPQLTAVDASGTIARAEAALEVAAHWIDEGKIVAVKGLGGYHIVVDAAQEQAVLRLRARKQRAHKPFAVMVRDLPAARRWVELDDFIAGQLQSSQAPIVLAPRTERGLREPAQSVAPGCPQLGIFLPYTPLHRLLLERLDRPLVCTSGNRSDQPTLHEDWMARESLSGIVDASLVHDRPILRQADDSVLQVISRPTVRPQLLRRARGFAPLPLLVPREIPSGIGVGAHMNVTFAVTRGREIILSPHLGEMNGLDGRDAYRSTLDDFLRLLDVKPRFVARDAHPDYFTSHLAQELAARFDVPLIDVQHHHAHHAAAALEHEIQGLCTSIVWDGTGLGDDGTIWGGEVLHGDVEATSRVASIVPFTLVGGEAAVHQTWRGALSLAHGASNGDGDLLDFVQSRLEVALAEAPVGAVRKLVEVQKNPLITTSVGRLFDGVSALLGLCYENTHQAQAPQMLQWAASAAGPMEGPCWKVETTDLDGLVRLDWRPVIRVILEQLRDGTAPGLLARGFHEWLAEGALTLAAPFARAPVLLTGGVFCNALLSEEVAVRAADRGIDVRLHAQLPPTDGAVAAGQAWTAVHRLDAE